jgi:AcrR family transcriptional regulator
VNRHRQNGSGASTSTRCPALDSSVALCLDVNPAPSLYRHVADKADLLDGMVELLLAEIPAPGQGPWADQLTAMARGIRAVASAHPAAFPLLLTRPAATDAALETRGSVYRALRAAGLAQDAVERTERLLSTAILGFVTSEAAGRFRNHDQATIDEDFAELLRWLRRILPDPPTESH